MPTGFDVESGSNLSPKLRELYPDFLDRLKRAREDGSVTPEKPITSTMICESYLKKRNIRLSGSDIRALVNHGRRRGEPIAVAETNKALNKKGGYFYAKSAGELDLTVQQLKDRVKAISAALDGVAKTQIKMRENLFDG